MVEDKAVELHRKYGGKIQVIPKVLIKSFEDFAIWYTPRVASPCRIISLDKDLELTSRWNLVAVVSDGSGVLGLGNIGPYAGYPVMEGKCLLFKFLGGVDAVPITLDTQDAEKIVEIVRLISPSFGGINLEDIESPKCFNILESLQNSPEIPVWHDGQQGTSLVVLAALINSLKIVGKKLEGARFLARYAENRGLSENNILPTMDDYMAHVEAAQSIAKKAVELNLARRKFSSNELYDAVHSIIAYQRFLMRSPVKSGLASGYKSNTPMGPEDG